MKPRRVIVTLELLTDKTVPELRDKDLWRTAVSRRGLLPKGTKESPVQRVQVNVIRPTKPERGGKARL